MELGTINNRKLIYHKHDISINWSKEFPSKDWLLLTLVSNKSKPILGEIANKALNNDVCYACCVGEQGELLHDMIDESIVAREVEIENNHLPNFDIMTTWHRTIEDGLWFAFFTAYHENQNIDKIVCLDAFDYPVKEFLIELIHKFNDGWIPD